MAEAHFFRLGELKPTAPPDARYYVAPGAQVIGDVRIGHGVSIWFNAVLRGDNEPIHLESGSNVQDGCVIHSDPGYPVRIGENVTIGHNATVHGCSIGTGSLIGMGATILNGASIGAFCMVAAGAVIRENMLVPDRSLVVGTPARIARVMTDEQIARMVAVAARYRDKMQAYTCTLTAMYEPDTRQP